MPEEDELVADLAEMLGAMVGDGSLELATRNDTVGLAEQLVALLRRDPHADLGEWLVEQDEVNELFLDAGQLAARAAPIVHRLHHGDPVPRWNAALAAAVAAAPDDVSARLVFADWLQEAGDPRGELIAVQVGLSRAPDDHQLRSREAMLLRRFRTLFLGTLPDTEARRVVFRHGFFDEAEFDAAFLDVLLDHPSLRFVRTLALTGSLPSLEALVAASPLPATLASLRLGTSTARAEAGSLRLDAVTRGLAALERLELASIANTVIDLRALELAKLRELVLAKTAVALAPYRDMPGDAWLRALPALESLALDEVALGADPESPWWALVRRPPPSLRALKLRTEVAEEWLKRLVDAPLLAQLRELDLRRTNLQHPELITANAARFAHLAVLDLRGASLDSESRRLLASLGPHVRVGTLRYDDDYDYDEDEDNGEDYDDEWDEYDPAINPDAPREDDVEEPPEDAELEEAGVDAGAPFEERDLGRDEDPAPDGELGQLAADVGMSIDLDDDGDD